MSEPGASPSKPRQSKPRQSSKPSPSKHLDVFLYTSAAITYVSLSIYNKWLLNWVLGPLWLVAWVWGLPALWKLIRRQPVRPQRGASPPPA
jgi:hypothetical protein